MEKKCRLSAPSGLVKVEVIDTGVGMSQDQLSKMFRDGVQFNVNQLQGGGGTGLGLFISKGLVEQHGGTLEVSSEGIGSGTTFTVTLPLSYVPEQDGEARSVTDGPAQPDPSKILPQNILVVDDVDMNRRLLARLAEKRGHIVTQAVDGQDAVKQVTKAMECGNTIERLSLLASRAMSWRKT